MEVTECMIHKDQSREIRTLYRYQIQKTETSAEGKIKITGEFVKVNPISDSLVKRLRENGMPEELLSSLVK